MKAAYMINVTNYEEGRMAPLAPVQSRFSPRERARQAQRAIEPPPAPAQEAAPDPTKDDTPKPHTGTRTDRR
jgi:hypothetical protein